MLYPLQDKYVSLLTDFGFKLVFGTEPNKRLLIDFLNTVLPEHHQIHDVTFKGNEDLGSTPIDRKAIFDIYCQTERGERFIVEIQKAKQNFFKDRSIYYSTFPIQEAIRGEWNDELAAVYIVGVLDFVFAEYQHDPELLHVVEWKNQQGHAFHRKLKYIYLELPKFTKTAEELETHFDKWLFLLKHLASLREPPERLQEELFSELFAVAEIAKFTPTEQESYQDSLKYYRDWHSISTTLKQEGRQEKALETVNRLLVRKLGLLPDEVAARVNDLSEEAIDSLTEMLLEFEGLADLEAWLAEGGG